MEQPSKLGERIALAVEKAGGKAATVNVTGIPASTLDRYMRGETEPQASKLAKISEASGYSLEWLIFGPRAIDNPPISDGGSPENDTVDSDVIYLPVMSAVGGSGAGVENHAVEVVDRLPFSRSLLRSYAANPDQCQVIRSTGDSMVPTIPDPALVIVDVSRRTLREDGVYCIALGDDIRFKRLQRTANGLTLISDNAKKYPPETLAGDELGRVKIIGRPLIGVGAL